MKGIFAIVAIALIAAAAWSLSDCNKKLPVDIFDKYQSNFCMCKSPYMKAQGINESKCILVHNDSLSACSAHDHCTGPEQCVKQTNGSFACSAVMAGCYEYMSSDLTIRKKCL